MEKGKCDVCDEERELRDFGGFKVCPKCLLVGKKNYGYLMNIITKKQEEKLWEKYPPEDF